MADVPEHSDVQYRPNRLYGTSYLIKCVVCCNSDCVGMEHQPFPEQCEETVSVHDFNFPSAIRDKNKILIT